MAVIECFTYNGEKDILRLHLAVMDQYVDKFIICEARTTFTRRPKPLYFFRDQRSFKPWWNRIEYFVIDDTYSEEELAEARATPLTAGASHWQWEYLQKSRLSKAISEQKPQDDDILLVGDVDEIVDIPTIEQNTPYKARLRVYNYYLDNESSEQFWGTLVAKYGDIKDKNLNELRASKELRSNKGFQGWHFSSMGGLPEVRRKLNDSYTAESYNVNVIPGHVEMCLTERKDLLNRPFTYTLSQDNWPQYLKNNTKKYEHLLWQS